MLRPCWYRREEVRTYVVWTMVGYVEVVYLCHCGDFHELGDTSHDHRIKLQCCRRPVFDRPGAQYDNRVFYDQTH